LAGYRIYRDDKLIGSIGTAGTAGTAAIDDSLRPGTQYDFSVSAFDRAGRESARSAPVRVTTLKDGPEPASIHQLAPSAPTGLRKETITAISVTLRWEAPQLNGGPPVVEYRIYRNGELLGSVPVKSTFAIDDTLRPATKYVYRVSAFDRLGRESPQSEEVEIATLD
jgi:chitinase